MWTTCWRCGTLHNACTSPSVHNHGLKHTTGCKVSTIRYPRSYQAENTNVRGQCELQVVLDIAKRGADAEGCKPPTELPPDAKKAWMQVHFMLGGNPRLMSYVLEIMGKRRSVELGFLWWGEEWNRGTSLVCVLSPCSISTASAAHLQRFIAFICFTMLWRCRSACSPAGVS